MLKKARRLFHTLAPLKLIQYWGLFYYRVFRRVVPFKPIKTKAKKYISNECVFHVYQPNSWLGQSTFRFLNHSAEVDLESWVATKETLLWNYFIHYFDWLNAKSNTHSSLDESRLIMSWWQTQKGRQGVAWEPYPTSLRAVNYCKWGWAKNKGQKLIPKNIWIDILDRHYQEVKRKLEYQIQANHLFANLKALYFLQAALPEYLNKDGHWLNKQILEELALQFDRDGGHFELSPMYHRIMLWDLFDMYVVSDVRVGSEAIKKAIKEILPLALSWSKSMSHPDGGVAFFNDATFGIAPEQSEIERYATALQFQIQKQKSGDYSGYIVAKNKKAYLICDAAKVGASIQPGHVHADSLSFELSIEKQRVFVNSGVSVYGASVERLRQRSTAAHNTVEYGGRNSSDVWSGFRVGKKAKIIKRTARFDEGEWYIKAAHDGYRPFIHTRRWVMRQNSLAITDELVGSDTKISYLHLHPNVGVEQVEGGYLLNWESGNLNLRVEGGDVTISKGTWHPAFGVVVDNYFLAIAWNDDACSVLMEW